MSMSSYSTRPHPVIVALAVLFIGAGSFIAGRISAPEKNAPAGRRPAATPASDSRKTATASTPALVGEQTSGGNWDRDAWNRLQKEPGTAARNKALARMLEELAASDPKQAMTMAQAEKNLQFRESLVLAVLKGWGTADPSAAVQWAKALPGESDRYAAVNSAFAGAAAKPEEAIRVALALGHENLADATQYATSLIRALTEAGDYANAVKLAAGTQEGFRGIWMAEAYSRWAVMQPEVAAQAAVVISDPKLRSEALHGVVSGWCDADPAGATQYLSTIPKGTPDATLMLGQALQAWAKLDQASVLQWVGQNDLGTEADDGIAAVASASFLKPADAATWAGCITDEKLRSSTMLTVLQNWWGADPEEAQRYLARATGLLPEDRRKAEEMLMLSNR